MKQCIACCKNDADSFEHIIPKCIGGRFQINFLCSSCNNFKFGSKLVGGLKKDPSIRIAISNLRKQLPDLYQSMENGQDYVASNKSGDSVKLKLKEGRHEVKFEKREDGSLIVDPDIGKSNISKILEKDGCSPQDIQQYIQDIDSMPENKTVNLTKRSGVTKHSIDSIVPDLGSDFIDDKLVALIAYEFLALICGKNIYNHSLGFLRDFINEGICTERINIQQFQADNYDTFHSICSEVRDNETNIKISFFRWLVYVVNIKNFSYSGPDIVFREDLKWKKTWIAKTNKAKQGIWTQLPNKWKN